MNDELRAELEAMRREDEEIRQEAWPIMQKHGLESPEYVEVRDRGRVIDARNVARLREIVEEHGWPRLSEVGETAAGGAFLILQHADVEVQKEYLPLAQAAVAAGEMRPADLALLEDRILLHEGKPQKYGSQFTRDAEGKPSLWPIEDEEHVDERRVDVGLQPLADYLERVGLGHLRGDAKGA